MLTLSHTWKDRHSQRGDVPLQGFLWECHPNSRSLVRFRHQNYLVRIRKRYWFKLKITNQCQRFTCDKKQPFGESPGFQHPSTSTSYPHRLCHSWPPKGFLAEGFLAEGPEVLFPHAGHSKQLLESYHYSGLLSFQKASSGLHFGCSKSFRTPFWCQIGESCVRPYL